MSEDIVISVDNVSKAYRIWESPSARLMSPLQEGLAGLLPRQSSPARWLKNRAARAYRDFYALNDVSFTVKRGEGVGIIGRNGSGKSTLLQIIAGTLQPTAGSVRVTGRVAALLELGSGFNPEFTGRENVYLNAAVLGLSKAETETRYPEIVAFADIGDFIDQPVKTYSSGMMMRLAFAVQSAVEPDVLIIDEALSVGDAPFQAKCFARIRLLLARGCSILFVSHDVGTVRTFCQQAVWLQHGRPLAQGAAPQVCDAYTRDCYRAMGMDFAEKGQGGPQSVSTGPKPSSSAWLQEDRTEFLKFAADERRGNGVVRLKNLFFLNEKQQRTATLRWDEEVTIIYILGSEQGYEGFFQVGLVCKTLQGQELLCCSDRTHGECLSLGAGEERAISLRTRLPLRGGQYAATAGVFLFPSDARFPIGTYDYTRASVTDYVPRSIVFSIQPQFNLGIHGPVQQESQLSIARR